MVIEKGTIVTIPLHGNEYNALIEGDTAGRMVIRFLTDPPGNIRREYVLDHFDLLEYEEFEIEEIIFFETVEKIIISLRVEEERK